MTKPFIGVSALALAGSVWILNGSPAHAHGNAGLVGAGAAYAFAGKITGEHFAARAQAVAPKMGGNFRVSVNVMESSVAIPRPHRPMGAVT